MRRGFLIILIVISVLGCATTPPYPVLQSGQPTIAAGSLAFAGNDGNLYVAQGGTDSIIRITDDARAESPGIWYSAYAWAGRRLVYSSQEFGSDGTVSSTLTVVQPGERPSDLFSQEGVVPFFLYPSPEGSRIGYLANQQDTARLRLASVAFETGEETVHGTGQPFYVAWSPDGSTLATHVGPSISAAASTLGLQDLNSPISDLDLRAGPFLSPAYSPDGERIAVILRGPSGPAVHLLDSTGRERYKLRDLTGSAGSVAWSPDGDRIAYVDGSYAQIGAIVGRLLVTGRQGGAPVLLSEQAMAPFWSPDGGKLAFFEPVVVLGQETNSILYRVGIYSVEEGSRYTVATMRPAPAFARQVIPFADQYERAYTIWSPDSRLIALNTFSTERKSIIHLLDTETGERLEETDVTPESFRTVSYRPPIVPTQMSTPGDDPAPGQGDSPSDQSGRPGLGLLASPGVETRALAEGVLPFFSSE